MKTLKIRDMRTAIFMGLIGIATSINEGVILGNLSLLLIALFLFAMDIIQMVIDSKNSN